MFGVMYPQKNTCCSTPWYYYPITFILIEENRRKSWPEMVVCELSLNSSNSIKMWCTVTSNKSNENCRRSKPEMNLYLSIFIKSNASTKIWFTGTSKRYALYHLIVQLSTKFTEPHSKKTVGRLIRKPSHIWNIFKNIVIILSKFGVH